jgi:hypothetical protein
MGDGRRVDTVKDQADREPIKRPDADREQEDGFDTSHAHRQLQARTPRGATVLDLPEHAFDGKGDQDELWSQLEAALAARVVSDRPLALVRDMNGATRANAGKKLTELARASTYSLTAPEEFFAECYMTYYLTSDGTPGTAAHKGELLAPWIKQWFDANVDKVGHNPSRGSY